MTLGRTEKGKPSGGMRKETCTIGRKNNGKAKEEAETQNFPKGEAQFSQEAIAGQECS
jgi:hypothetical protein